MKAIIDGSALDKGISVDFSEDSIWVHPYVIMNPLYLRQNIFEPFAQERADARSNYHGTGLGMAIVKKMIDKMGGTISYQRSGKGIHFCS